MQLDSFQEWPQLLDPILADLVHSLADAFLSYCLNSHDAYSQPSSIHVTHIEPLSRAICRLLYVFCKVRGHKVILRLLNNEPKWIEPLLMCFQAWSGQMSWEERYVILLWLSHLMLAPFELSTISAFSSKNEAVPEAFAKHGLPDVAQVLLAVALKHLCFPSKDREAASTLVVRLALRGDMQRLRLPGAVIDWCTQQLSINDNHAASDQYRHVGLLTLLYGMINSASSAEAAPFIEKTFRTCYLLSTDDSEGAIAARQAAPSRKLLIKSIRSSLLHMTALSANGSETASELLDTALEEGIQILLEWLADSDTPVRQAASKALGSTILKLPGEMAIEVIQAVLDCLNENMLLENRRTGQLVAVTDLLAVDMDQYRKNVNAVNPLQWHGAMLTLGHVLFRRSPPPEQLSTILEALVMGLNFEQRSNVGTSLGVGVRDAACFGLWSLARKYTTSEVRAADLPATSKAVHVLEQAESISTLQRIATELVLSSCLDPSGNLRRGSSAALQELIGRHPDEIESGISVVQQVDYHAVARRSRAMSEVSEAVSQLGEVYHVSLLYALLDWRGCRAVDAESRRQAASTAGLLLSKAELNVQTCFCREVVAQIQDLKSSNVGSNAATRHGLLLTLAAILEQALAYTSGKHEMLEVLSPVLRDFETTVGSLVGKTTSDLVNVLGATAKLIAAEANLAPEMHAIIPEAAFLLSVQPILNRCTVATEDELVSQAAAEANGAVFELLNLEAKSALLESWLSVILPKKRSDYTCKGRIESLSMISALLGSNDALASFKLRIASFLSSIIPSDLAIETRVNAMDGISKVIKSIDCSDTELLAVLIRAITSGLLDYTNDQRGDVGSLLRLSSITTAQDFLLKTDKSALETLIRPVARLAAEKLTKVRFLAWTCLSKFWHTFMGETQPVQCFQHVADVSSFEYFRQLVELLTVTALREDVLTGLVTSIAGGADDISRDASDAFIAFLYDQRRVDLEKQFRWITTFLLSELRRLAMHDDREVVPLLGTLCLILEQFGTDLAIDEIEMLDVMEILQSPAADIPCIEALIRLLSLLSIMYSSKQQTMDRITRKLLHKWPKVRHSAVEAVFMLHKGAVPLAVDWNANPVQNKAAVVELRKAIGVAGRAA